MRRTTIRIVALSWLTMLGIGSAAAEDEASLPDAVQLDTVQVTAARHQESSFDIPQAVTVVTRKQIERQTPQVMTDLLRGQTGVFTQASGPGQGIVIIRGLKGSEVLHLVDGMRLNNSFFRNSPSQYIALVDPYNIQRMEVVRGASASLYGSDAMGGVVQILTPEPRFKGDAWRGSGSLLGQYASAANAWVGRAAGAVGRDGMALSAGYTSMDHESQLIGNGERVQPTAFRAEGYDAKLLVGGADSPHEAMLNTSHFEFPNLPRYFEVAGGPGGEGNSLQAYFRPNGRSFWHARYRYLAPLGFLESLELHLARQEIEDAQFRQPNDTRTESDDTASTMDGITAQAQSALGPLHLIWGAEWYEDEVSSRKTRTSLETGETTADLSRFPDGAVQTSVGANLAADWKPMPRWLLETGLRFSIVESDIPATPVNSAADVRSDGTTGNLGVRYALTEQLHWTANAARGFRAPNLFDLGTLGLRPNTSPGQINVPNTTLEPETVTTVDTGLKWLSGAWAAELSLWASEYQDKIEAREPTGNVVPDGQYGCATPEGCIEVRSENISQARYHGVESGLRWQRTAWNAYGTLNWTWGEESREGEPSTPANRVPPLNGQLGLIWTGIDRVDVEPFVQFAASQNRLDDDDQGDVRIDPEGTAGWATINLRLGWAPLPGWRVQASGLNLGDQSYREHGSGIDGAGRSLVLTLRWESGGAG